MEPPARLDEEVQSLHAVVTSAVAALRTFTGELPYDERDDPSSLPTIHTVSELISLAVAMLQRDKSQSRLRLLLCPEGPGLLTALAAYLVARIEHAPGVAAPEARLEAIAGLRVLILNSLAQVVTLTCYDDVPDTASLGLGDTCADLIAQEFERMQIPAALAGIASGAKHVAERIKVAAAECLFVYALRNAAGRADLARTAVGQLLRLLIEEPSPMVRNYAAACLRECVQTHAREVDAAGFGECVAQIAGTDGSTDVRVLALEAFEVVCKAMPGAKVDPRLADACIQLLGQSAAAPEVADRACRVVDTVVVQESRLARDAVAATPGLPLAQQPCGFTLRLVAEGGVEALLRMLLHHSNPRIVAPAARALRRIVQHVPWRLGVARRIGNSALNDMLELLIASAAAGVPPRSASASSTDTAEVENFKLYALVEISLAVAMVFSQSADVRNQLAHTASGSPEWCAAARSALLGYLDEASQEYFLDIELCDEQTGVRLNTLEGVEWDAQGWPTRDSVCQALNGVLAAGPVPPSMQYNLQGIQQMRLARFTQVLLRFSVHLALSDEEADEGARRGGPRSSSAARGAAAGVSPRLSPEPPKAEGGGQKRSQQHLGPMHEPFSVPPPAWSGGGGGGGGGAAARSRSRSASQPRNPRRASSGGGGGGGGVAAGGGRGARLSRSPPGPPPEVRYPGGGGGGGGGVRSRSSQPPPGVLRSGSGGGGGGGAAPSPLVSSGNNRRSTSQPPLGFTDPRGATIPRPPEVNPLQFSAHDDALKFAVRHSRHFSSTVQRTKGHAMGAPRWSEPSYQNPWKQPARKSNTDQRVWTVADLKAGDLFMFSLPYADLTVASVERTLFAARRHQSEVKKSFLTTPQRARGRRWCLFDLLNLVMPHLQHALVTLAKLLLAIGEREAQVPIFMLREDEIAAGEVAITPGILADVVEQLTYYHQVHLPPPDDAAEIVEKLQALARNDPEGFQDLSSSDESSG